MTSYSPIELRALFRASHSSIWELADGAGILDDLNILLVSLDPCPTSAIAEAVLTEGAVDLVSGNHVTLYGKVARGEPLVRGPSTFDLRSRKQPIHGRALRLCSTPWSRAAVVI